MGPTLPPVQWVQEAVSLGINGQVHEAYHAFSFRVVVKSEWSYSSTPPVPRLCAQGKLCRSYHLNLVILSSPLLSSIRIKRTSYAVVTCPGTRDPPPSIRKLSSFKITT